MRDNGTSKDVKTYRFSPVCREPLRELNIKEFIVFHYVDDYNIYSIERQNFVFAEIFSDFYDDAREVAIEGH